MRSDNNQIRTVITLLMFLAFAAGVAYIVGHLTDVGKVIMGAVNARQKGYINISNLAYCSLGIAHVVLVMVLMYPFKDMKSRRIGIKRSCYALSIIFLLGNFWIFTWLFQSIAARSFSFDFSQFQRTQNMMFNHMQWISRNPDTLFYNYLSAFIWFSIGQYFDTDRKKTVVYFAAQVILSCFVPAVVYYFYRGNGVPDWWLKKTVTIFISDALVFACLLYAQQSREVWVKFICPASVDSDIEGDHHRHSHHRHSHHHHSHHHHRGGGRAAADESASPLVDTSKLSNGDR